MPANATRVRRNDAVTRHGAGSPNGRVKSTLAARRHALSPHAAVGLSDDQVRALFRAMLLARTVDERQWILNRQGKQAFHISCQGHEASAAGSAFALEPGHDLMVPYYRSLAACLVFGMTARDILLAGLAKAEDPASGGRQMPAHYSHAELGILSSGSPVATQIPHAAGAALASKIRGEGSVVVTYFGDGASSKGDFHEGLNFAAIHKLPAIFICENNHYAISVPQSKQMAVGSVADRGAAYGIPGVAVDGTDALAVYQAVKTAVDRARAGEGPTLIEANVVRITPHSSDDDDRRYRSESDREDARQHDPIRRFRAYLREWGLLDDRSEEALRADVTREVDEALAYAEQAVEPAAETAFDHVYADQRVLDLRAQLREGVASHV
jgi:2-oxoisovalerate dehydrogenase E1 component alpha subunit